jgi:uncharacterized protein YfdQ (DUF2303 family)
MSAPTIDMTLLRDIISGGLNPAEGVCLIPEGYKLADLEQYQAQPNALRGTYHARTIAEFARYVLEQDSLRYARIFLDPEAMSAVARLDHGNAGDPGWGRHRAAVKLASPPAFAAFMEIAAAPVTQTLLIDYVTDWADHLEFSAAGAEAPWVDMKPAAAVQALRKVSTEVHRDATHTQTDTARERSVLEKASIVSTPPLLLRWSGIPAEGLAERSLRARLVYLPKDPPQIRVRPIGLAELRQAMADEFRDQVREAIAEAAPVHIGTFG